MSQTQRTITTALWILVVVSLLGLIAMQRVQAGREQRAARVAQQMKDGVVFEMREDGTLVPSTQRGPFVGWDAPTFTLTDQQGQPFDSDALKGKVWAAAFFFSQCQGICPGMLGKVQKLSAAVPDQDVHIAYFTVDPERDTPERLGAYGAEAKADPARWHMLTGAVNEMKRIARGFKVGYETPAQHTGKIFLVDQKGVVRAFYEQSSEDDMKMLAGDAKKLLAGEALQ